MDPNFTKASSLRVVAFDDTEKDSIWLVKVNHEPDDDFWMIPTIGIEEDIDIALLKYFSEVEIWPKSCESISSGSSFSYPSDSAEKIRINNLQLVKATTHHEGKLIEKKTANYTFRLFDIKTIKEKLAPINISATQFDVLDHPAITGESIFHNLLQ